MESLKEVKYIILHHTQGKKYSIDSLRNLHVKTNGWEDIGYHWVIGNGSEFTQDGKIYPARSEKFAGAHVLGHNKNSIGIALIGNFDENPPSEKQMISLIKLLKQKIKQYNIKIENIKGHNEFEGVTKTCPGKKLDMNKLRKILKK